MGDSAISAQLAKAGKGKKNDRELAQQAADFAQELLIQSLKALKSDERTLLAALSRLAADERNRSFIHSLCAQVFHAPDTATQAANLRQLLSDFGGIPTIFSTMGRLRLRAAGMAAGSIQSTAMAEVRRIFRSTFGELSLPTQVDKVNRRVRDFGKEGITLALNPLSPEVFGNKGAERYLHNLEAILSKQEGVGLCIEPWRLVPGLSPYRPSHAAHELADRLKPLIKLTLKGGKVRPLVIRTGTSDIMPVIIEGVKLALAGTAFHQAELIIELPGYLRQAPALLRELTEWAQARAAKGTKPLRVMLDKGSHLAAERERCYTYGDACAAAANKGETDTRYKQLIHNAITAPAKALHPCIATHNLFDLAYALLDWARSGRDGLPDFVFTAGLGNHIGRMLSRAGAGVTLVSSIVSEEGEAEFEKYLLSLINEVSMPDSVLAAGPALEPTSMVWGRMRQQFLAALSGREEQLNLAQEQEARRNSSNYAGSCLSEALNRAGMDSLYAAAENAAQANRLPYLPLVIDGQEVSTPLTGIHRSLTAAGVEEYRFTCADYPAVEQALQLAHRATAGEPSPMEERRRQLLQLARQLDKARIQLCSTLVRDAGFTIRDADCELRDAADACRFYEQSISRSGWLDGSHPTPLGLVVVAGDRAHPLRSAVAGIAAAWVTGNCVIYKPSMASVRLGHELAALLQEAGFESPRFQALTCLDNQIADKLMTDARVDGLIISGNAPVATRLAAAAPTHALLCSEAGVSSAYLAPECDWQQAIRDITTAAFRRSGQDASCPHILLVDAGIYDRQGFMNALKDAVLSLRVLPGWTEAADLGPLARPLTGAERRLLTKLEPGEAWHVQPATQELQSQLWSPGVVLGVKPGSPITSRSVQNLPLIGLIRTENPAEACRIQRRLSAGAAAALYSLDESVISQWRKEMGGWRAQCSKLFINCCPENRPGLLPSASSWLPARGAAPQAGGDNYLAALCRWQETARPQNLSQVRNLPFAPWEALSPKPSPDDSMRLHAAANSIAYWWENEFGQERVTDPHPGRRSTRSYHPIPLCLRIEKASSDIDLSIALMAALKAGCDVHLSSASLRPWFPRLESLGVAVTIEPRAEFEARFPELAERSFTVRDTAATETSYARAAAAGLAINAASILANGRLELLHCLRECVTTRRSSVDEGKPGR